MQGKVQTFSFFGIISKKAETRFKKVFSLFKKRLPEAPADSLPIGSVFFGGIYTHNNTGQRVVVLRVAVDTFADGKCETVVTYKALDNSNPYFREMGTKFFLKEFTYEK